MRRCDELFEIRARQGFSTRQVKMQHTHLRGLSENAQPVFRFQFRVCRSQLQRIGTVHAVQRATMRDLGDESERIRKRQHQ